jgi:hypothetical protein
MLPRRTTKVIGIAIIKIRPVIEIPLRKSDARISTTRVNGTIIR